MDDELFLRLLAERDAAGSDLWVRRLDEFHAEHPFPWRTGTSVPFNVYDDNPDGHGGKRGRFVGSMRTAEQAYVVCVAMNMLARRAGLISDG